MYEAGAMETAVAALAPAATADGFPAVNSASVEPEGMPATVSELIKKEGVRKWMLNKATRHKTLLTIVIENCQCGIAKCRNGLLMCRCCLLFGMLLLLLLGCSNGRQR